MEEFFILVDGAQKDFTCDLPLFIFLYDFLYCQGVLFPDLLHDEGWICQDEVEIVVVFLWDVLWMVEVVFKVVRVLLAELLIKLYNNIKLHQRQNTPWRNRGFILRRRCLGWKGNSLFRILLPDWLRTRWSFVSTNIG